MASTEWFFVYCFQVELEFGNVGFQGKPEYPEKNPRSSIVKTFAYFTKEGSPCLKCEEVIHSASPEMLHLVL